MAWKGGKCRSSGRSSILDGKFFTGKRRGRPRGADQPREKVRFLSDPSAYGEAGTRVEVVETHMSFVFLVGDRAFKFKNPSNGLS